MGYTKLFNEILASTIWDNEWYVKVTWITILAMKDERHQVMASIPGLAHMARVSVDQCQEAINKFCSPDPYSRSKEHEGRRLQPIDGGWYVINGPKYSHRLSIEDKKEYQRIWVKNKRLEQKIEKIESRQKSTVDKVDDVDTTEHNITKHNKTKNYIGQIKNEFDQFWNVYPKKVAKKDALRAFTRLAPTKELLSQIVEDVQKRSKSPKWCEDQGKYIPNPSTYLRGNRWEDLSTDNIKPIDPMDLWLERKQKEGNQ